MPNHPNRGRSIPSSNREHHAQQHHALWCGRYTPRLYDEMTENYALEIWSFRGEERLGA